MPAFHTFPEVETLLTEESAAVGAALAAGENPFQIAPVDAAHHPN